MTRKEKMSMLFQGTSSRSLVFFVNRIFGPHPNPLPKGEGQMKRLGDGQGDYTIGVIMSPGLFPVI